MTEETERQELSQEEMLNYAEKNRPCLVKIEFIKNEETPVGNINKGERDEVEINTARNYFNSGLAKILQIKEIEGNDNFWSVED